MRWLLVLLFAVSLGAQELAVPCQPAPETLKILEALPAVRDYSISFEARVAPLRALAEKSPGDFFIQRFYQDAFRRSFQLSDEFDRALAMYRKRPANPLSRYLEARLLMFADPASARATFDELLSKNPGFVWPHIDFLEWTLFPGQRDATQADSHVKAFLAACPEAPEVYEHFALVQDPQLLKQGADNLRRALIRRGTPLDAVHWPDLWFLETRAGVDAQVLSERIHEDLKRIEAGGFRPRPELFQVYSQAAGLLKDPGVLQSFQAAVAKEAPQSLLMLSLLQAEWSRRNPFPPRDATPDQRKAYEDSQAKAETEWRKQWPANCGLAQQQWGRVSSAAQGAKPPDAAEAVSLAELLLRCREQFPDAGMSVPPMETLAAQLYVRLNTHLDQVPRLLDAGLRAIEKQEKYRLSMDLLPAELRQRAARTNLELVATRTQEIRADYFLTANRLAEARGLAEQELARLEASKPAPDAPAQEQRRAQYERSQWLLRLGKIAEKQNLVERALVFYQASLEGTPKEALASSNSSTLVSIKGFYLTHGGSDEKWLEWASAAGKEPATVWKQPAVEFVQLLPDFSAKDLAGRSWQLKDLKGKVTFINFWATWCGPCRGEHPDVQKLHDRLKGRADLQVLTLSVDDQPALVASYLKEKGYTFPVIHAIELADKLFPYVGLPANLLVNANGWRTSLYPFTGGEEGLRQVIAGMETAAAVKRD